MKGAVALEFLLLFPLIFSLIYVAGVYGVLFSWQVQMQLAVDRSTAAVMALDRSATDKPEDAAVALANAALAKMDLSFIDDPGTCEGEDGVVVCALAVPMDGGGCGGDEESAEGPKQLGFFGGFPPLPDCLRASARVAF